MTWSSIFQYKYEFLYWKSPCYTVQVALRPIWFDFEYVTNLGEYVTNFDECVANIGEYVTNFGDDLWPLPIVPRVHLWQSRDYLLWLLNTGMLIVFFALYHLFLSLGRYW